jgi:hypothetical protein
MRGETRQTRKRAATIWGECGMFLLDCSVPSDGILFHRHSGVSNSLIEVIKHQKKKEKKFELVYMHHLAQSGRVLIFLKLFLRVSIRHIIS